MHDIGSDTESVVVSAPLHGPTTVSCVCVCKKRGCKFVDRPFDADSVRESPIAKVSARYRIVTWLSSLRPHHGSEFTAPDQIDGSAKVHPEKKSKIIQMFRSRRFLGGRTNGEVTGTDSSTENVGRKHYPGLSGARKHVLPGRLKECHLSVPRWFGVMIGMTFVMLGMTYDHGVKHGVDNLLQDCWVWLRTSYMNFGDEFVSYNSLFFRMANRDVLYGEPYPKSNPDNKTTSANATTFKDAINKVDPKFLFVLEGLKLSVQVHFFSIDENSNTFNPEVMVHDRGPLFFRISFRRTAGLHVEFVPERSNMTLTTPFHIYDLMKLIMASNGIPYFGMHMHDYLKTTPSALFTMIIENLKLLNVDTTFLSSIQAQIQSRRGGYRRFRRSSEVEKVKDTTTTTARHSIPSVSPTEQPRKATTTATGTFSGYTAAPVTTTATERHWNMTTSGLPFTATTILSRARRSTEEPSMKKVAWKALTEISRKIFLPLPLDTKKTVLLPVPFIEKNLTLRYRHAVNVLGLPGYQFILGNEVTNNTNPWESPPHDLYPSLSYSRVKDDTADEDAANSHQQRHRYNDKKKHLHHRHSKHQNTLETDVYRRSFNDVLGVVDLEDLFVQSIGKQLLMGRELNSFPFWLSPPHFLSLADRLGKYKPNLNARQSSSNSSGTSKTNTKGGSGEQDSTVGLGSVSPNESLHGSFIYYHPILGVPINASLAVQVGVRPPKSMLFSHKLVPIMWTRVQVEEVPRSLWYILWAACHLRETIMASLICFGLLIITCSLTCFRKKRRRQERPGSA